MFTVAGVHLSDELAASIVDEVRTQLPPNQKEPKYASLARSSRGRKALMRAFEQMPQGSTRSYLVDKRFMVVTKLVDVLLEPLAHAKGYNLYEDGKAPDLARALHADGPVLGDAAAYDCLLRAFVEWIRQRAAIDDLFAALAAYKESVVHTELAELVGLVERCRDVAEKTAADIAAGRLPDLLDPAVTSLYCLCVSFGEAIGQFRLVHDESKVINRNAVELRAVHRLPDPARPGRFMRPIMASQIDFADSKAHPQLQLADWAAGAVRQWGTHMAVGGGDRFSEELGDVVRPWLVDMIWPRNTGL